MASTDFGLDDRTIIITGVARGLGASIAQAILAAGGDVFGIDILAEPTEDDWRDYNKLSKTSERHFTFFQADVCDERLIESAVAKARSLATQRLKPILGLVNCAGVQYTSNAEEFEVQQFRRVIDINVVGSFIVAKQVARTMIAEKWEGSMVLIGSIAGYVANRVC